MKNAFRLVAVAGLALAAPCAFGQLSNGVAAGETTANSSLLWTRSESLGNVTFEVSTDPLFNNIIRTQNVAVTDVSAPVKAPVTGLSSGSQYYYRATDASGARSAGTFKTPTTVGRNGFRMGVSGDWRGELAPYPSLRNVAGANLDMFMNLGDTIYADVSSPAVQGQAQTLAQYRAKHNEVLSSHLGLNIHRDIRQSTSVYAVIDDHEVTNDFAGGAAASTDPRFGTNTGLINQTQLYNNGLQAFQEYHPMESRTWSGTGDARTDGRPDLYRTQQYGQDAQFFSVDARSFRDQELPAANPANPASWPGYVASTFTPGRTMLGNPQLDRLMADLSASQAAGVTWKFVMMPEPAQNLGVLAASDRYEGYAAERNNLLRYIDEQNIENVVFVTADIHGSLVNNLTYNSAPFAPQIQSGAWEISTGSGAYSAPFGPTVAGLAAQLNLPGSIPIQTYLSLPVAQQEAYIQGLINAQLGPLGYDLLGLQGSGIPAQLLQGTWTATNTFGWTEFDVNPLTQQLRVTTWGVPWYDEAFLLANPQIVASLQPQIMQQFTVDAIPAPGAGAVAFGLLALAGRRRR
ncbi:MAG: alkaline phosphatase D family protein [Phycisphaerales bacterium]